MCSRKMVSPPLAGSLTVLFSAVLLFAGGVKEQASTIRPYIDGQTILVAHVDVSRIDVDGVIALLDDFLPADAWKKQIDQAGLAAKAWLSGFQRSGGRDIFAVLSFADMVLPDRPDIPFFLVVPVAEGGDAEALKKMIPTRSATKEPNSPLQTVERVALGGPLVFGSGPVIERLKALGHSRPPSAEAVRDRLARALAAVDSAALQVVFIPTEDQRRVVREMLPKLPKPFDAIDGRVLADGIRWKAVGIDPPPTLSLRSVVQSQDAAAAERLAAAWQQVLDFVASEPKIRQQVPTIGQVVPLLRPTVQADRVIVTIKAEAVALIVKRLLLPAMAAAKASAHRERRMNQFKQLALAMHNWSEANKKDGIRRFPPAAITSEQGEPLLSWRVAILPYLEQQELYDQFHLDEPWDSEHNKKLLEQMPDVYRDHELASVLGTDRLAPGSTTYVVPVGEGLVFGGKDPTPLKEITDGLSKTIMIVEVTPDRAVPWTKPAEWRVDKITRDPKTFRITSGDPLRGVRRTDRGFFTVVLCDGAGRIIANEIDPSQFYSLLTRAGGEVIDW